jgi:NitT/TauT family transport system permease protein
MLGYGLAVVIGITLGLAMGYYRLLYNLFEPLVEVLRPIPGPAYLPILVLFRCNPCRRPRARLSLSILKM